MFKKKLQGIIWGATLACRVPQVTNNFPKTKKDGCRCKWQGTHRIKDLQGCAPPALGHSAWSASSLAPCRLCLLLP